MKIDAREPNPGSESGSIMIAFLATILPLVLLVGTASVTMTSRNTRLMFDIAQEKAFMAAESGLDESLHRINNGTLTLGEELTGEVGSVPYVVEIVNLRTDGLESFGRTAQEAAEAMRAFGRAAHSLNAALYAEDIVRRRKKRARAKRRARKLRRGWR